MSSPHQSGTMVALFFCGAAKASDHELAASATAPTGALPEWALRGGEPAGAVPFISGSGGQQILIAPYE